MKFLNGKKTYLIAFLMFMFGLFGLLVGWLEPEKGIELMMESGIGAALRNGISNK